MNKKLLLLLFLLYTFCLSLKAQLIEGTVYNALGQPLRYVTITLQFQKDSFVLEQTLTDSAGYFSFNRAASWSTIITAEAFGYKGQSKKVTDTSAGIDFVLLPDSKKLKEVIITSVKPLIELKPDRLVFNVENSIAGMGSDAMELIKKTPGVRISNDQISLIGKSSVSVMINNKLVQLSGDELTALLRSISSDGVSKIEVITMPSARYEADGASGLINIITKKWVRDGFNAVASASYEQATYASMLTSFNFNYRKRAVNFYGNGNSGNNVSAPDNNTTAFYPGEKRVQEAISKNRYPYNRVQLGIDYKLTPHAILGIVATCGDSKPQKQDGVRSQFYHLNPVVIDSTGYTDAKENGRGKRQVLNANYEWDIDSTGKKLTVDLDYFKRAGWNSRKLTTADYLQDSYVPTGFRSTARISGEQIIDIRSAKFDIEWPADFASYSGGGKISVVQNSSYNLFEDYNGLAYTTDPLKTARFRYREATQALYINAQKEMGKWEVQAGMRWEATQTTGLSQALNQTTNNKYIKVFPTAYVSYKINEGHSVNLSCNRRIDRPAFLLLNPFRTYYTSDSYEEGNPFLQPSFTNNFEISYSLFSKYIFKVYSETEKDLYTQISIIDTAKKSVYYRQQNAGKAGNYGFTAEAVLTPVTWLETNLSLNLFYSAFSSTIYNSTKEYGRPAFYFETSNELYLNRSKTWSAEVGFSYQSAQQADVDRQAVYYNLSAGVKLLLLKKALAIALTGNDLLATDTEDYRNVFNGTLQNNYGDERYVRISATLKLGKKTVKEKRERETGAGEESRAK